MPSSDDLISQAEKAKNKTNFFFRPSPDWDEAARCYEQAGTSLIAQKQYERAITIYQESARCYAESQVPFMAGKMLENAANVYTKYLKSKAESNRNAAELLAQSAKHMMANNSWDRAIDQYTKAAKCLEEDAKYLDACIGYYGDAIDCIDQDGEPGRLRISADTYQRYISLLIRTQRFPQAIQIMSRFSKGLLKLKKPDMLYCRNALAWLIVLLHSGDEARAASLFEQLTIESDGVWARSDESRLAHDLLDSFEEKNNEKLKEVQSRQFITFLDKDVAKLARNLVVIGKGNTVEEVVRATNYNPEVSTALVDDLPPQTSAEVNRPSPEETNDLC